MRLRALEFEKNEDFKPLASQVSLNETDFDDLVQSGELAKVYKIEEIVTLLEGFPPPPRPPRPPPPTPPHFRLL